MSTTSLNQHLQNGKGESLARAKAALKGRLKQRMMQDVLDELQDTEHVVNEAMDALASNAEALEAAREAFKTRLLGHIRQQAVEEIVAEVESADLDSHADEGVLSEAKDAFKQRLFSHVLQQAVDEVGVEVGGAEEAVETHGEQLTEASDTFKARLRDQVFRQAVEQVSTEVSQAQEAPQTHGDPLAEAKDAFKARLRDQVFEQAVQEIDAEAAGVQDDLLAQADENALSGVKEALKKRLLDQVFQQAIAEIDAEVDVTSDDLEAFALNQDEHEDVEPLSDFTLDVPDEEEAFTDDQGAFPEHDDLFADSEEVLAEDDQALDAGEEDPIIDVQFWDDEADASEEDADSSVELSLPDDSLGEGDDSSFFLSDPSAPGNGFEEAEPDAEAVGAEWPDASVDDLLEFAGDGAWEDSVPHADTQSESFDDIVEALEQNEDGIAEDGIVYYVYGILSQESLAEDMLPIDGIDPDYPIFAVAHDHGVALVSKVPETDYGQEALPVNLLDPVWKEEREKAHEAAVALFSGSGFLLPVPPCTVYDSVTDIHQLFSEISYQDALEKIKGRSQWRIRLYRDVDVLHQQVVENSAAVQQLMADIKSKPKGGAHSIKKKMVSTIHEEEASLTDQCTKDVHERLFAHSDDVELGVLDGADDRDKVELILDATYLVHRDDQEIFSSDIEQLVVEYATSGFEFEVTGPEPPTLFSQLHPFSKA